MFYEYGERPCQSCLMPCRNECSFPRVHLAIVDLQKNWAKLEAIRDMAFWSCQQLTTVQFGLNLQMIISNEAFCECRKLKTIHWNEETRAFQICCGLEELDMSVLKKISEISESCFFSCAALRTAILPPDLKKIEEWAFSYCGALHHVTCNIAQLTAIASFCLLRLLKSCGVRFVTSSAL